VTELDFEVHVDQNRYLPSGGEVMDAVVSVRCRGVGMKKAPSVAQVIMLDCSYSMEGAKLVQAKRAAAVAIDALRDGTRFAVVAGASHAWMAYPTEQKLVTASQRTRAEAKQALQRLRVTGSTAIGKWLLLGDRLLASAGTDIRHGILLTDGQNVDETPERFAEILDQCAGHFVCDSRGVGDGWEADTLLAIAETLLGSADGLPDPADLPAEFRRLTEAVMGKAAADVRLRLWTPDDSDLTAVRLVHPRISELTDRGVAVDEWTTDFPTGSWGDETRYYQVSVRVPAGIPGEGEMVAAHVSVAVGDVVYGSGEILAEWTVDLAKSTKINPQVAHYTGQVELAEAIQDGLAARAAGDLDGAERLLGRAVRLADESGHRDTLKVLADVVDVLDAASGSVKVHPASGGVAEEMAAVRSVMTVPAGHQPAAPSVQARPEGTWFAVVSADRRYYDFVQANGLPAAETVAFPEGTRDRRIQLRSARLLIGRRSRALDVDPEIDLGGPGSDPGIGHQHGWLISRKDGWLLMAGESKNGMFLNDSRTPVQPNLPIPITDGDRVHLGAWTTLTLRRA